MKHVAQFLLRFGQFMCENTENTLEYMCIDYKSADNYNLIIVKVNRQNEKDTAQQVAQPKERRERIQWPERKKRPYTRNHPYGKP